jgi:hypothetical protein
LLERSRRLLPYHVNFFADSREVAIEMYESNSGRWSTDPTGGIAFRRADRIPGSNRSLAGQLHDSAFCVEPRRVFDELLKRGILIRDVTGYPMLKLLPIGIGTPEENNLLLESLREIFAA